MFKLVQIGDTTYSSDPQKKHKSYTVFMASSGKKYFTRVLGRWHYAHATRPTGFDVGKIVPRKVAALLP